MKKIIINILACSTIISAWALGEQLTGTEIGFGSNKVAACKNARDQADSKMNGQIQFLLGTGQVPNEKKAKGNVQGCDCTETQTKDFQCYAVWSIKVD